MILGDFGGPGVHFLMIFEARGLILEAWRPILTISWIFSDFGDLTPLKSYSLFGSFFDTFCIQFFSVFLNARFSGFFVILGAQRLQNGRHLEVILLTFLMTGYFLIFATPTVRNLDF